MSDQKEKEITEKDLFGDKEENNNTTKQTKEVKEKANIPHYYIPIELNSLGKLSAPPVLHFRNFSPNESAKLATCSSDDEYKVFIECFNAMIWEDFDCSNLHIKELLTILYTLHGSFFSNIIEKKYYINEDLEEPELSADENIDTAEIPISNFKTNTLPKEFKEPITITSNVTGVKAKFRFPRVGFALQAKAFLEEKYRKEMKDFHDLKVKLTEISEISDEDKQETKLYKINADERIKYEKFQRSYWQEFAIIMNALSIVQVDDKKANSIEEHIELSSMIDNSIQAKFNQIQKAYDFGIEEEVEYYSTTFKENRTRGFRFRFSDFISDSEQSTTDSQFDIQFG